MFRRCHLDLCCSSSLALFHGTHMTLIAKTQILKIALISRRL